MTIVNVIEIPDFCQWRVEGFPCTKPFRHSEPCQTEDCQRRWVANGQPGGRLECYIHSDDSACNQENCAVCRKPMTSAPRYIVGGKHYHANCYKEAINHG